LTRVTAGGVQARPRTSSFGTPAPLAPPPPFFLEPPPLPPFDLPLPPPPPPALPPPACSLSSFRVSASMSELPSSSETSAAQKGNDSNFAHTTLPTSKPAHARTHTDKMVGVKFGSEKMKKGAGLGWVARTARIDSRLLFARGFATPKPPLRCCCTPARRRCATAATA